MTIPSYQLKQGLLRFRQGVSQGALLGVRGGVKPIRRYPVVAAGSGAHQQAVPAYRRPAARLRTMSGAPQESRLAVPGV